MIYYMMMIIIQNICTLCKYVIHKTCGFTGSYRLFFEYIHDDSDDEDDEVPCNCNLCSTTRNVILFATRRLKYC